MELISQELNNKLNQLVGYCFRLNRILDRGMSMLSVKFKLLNSARVLHPRLAHAMPVLADDISDYQGTRNMLTVYPATLEGSAEYSSPLEFFKEILEEFNTFENMISDTVDFSIMDKDNTTKVFLDGFLLKWSKYVETANNIVDVAEMYGTDTKSMQQFDEEIEHCLTVG